MIFAKRASLGRRSFAGVREALAVPFAASDTLGLGFRAVPIKGLADRSVLLRPSQLVAGGFEDPSEQHAFSRALSTTSSVPIFPNSSAISDDMGKLIPLCSMISAFFSGVAPLKTTSIMSSLL